MEYADSSAHSWFYLVKHRIDVGLKLVIGVVIENIVLHISVKQIVHRWIVAPPLVAHTTRCKQDIAQLRIANLPCINALYRKNTDIIHTLKNENQ